jgi:hypothetical protein
MTKRDQLARKLDFIERFENLACGGAAVLVTAVYFFYELFAEHVIASRSWVVPMFVVFILAKLGFAIWGGRVDAARRALDAAPELPLARANQVRRRSNSAVTIKPSSIELPSPPVSQQPPWADTSVQDGAARGPRILVDGTSARTEPS